MTEFLQQLINGLAFGSILALIAIGYTMVYGILRFINFAHGDVFMLGAFAGFYLAPKIATILPLPSIAGALVVMGISMAICAALGGWSDRLGGVDWDLAAGHALPLLVGGKRAAGRGAAV